MPGLLDLPVELLEQIYDDLSDELDSDTWYQLGHLRLTCRYVEKAIRPHFLEDQCYCNSIKVTDDESILKFCTTTANPDFAKAYKCLHLLTHDDGTVEAEARTLGAHSPAKSSEHVEAQFAELQTDSPVAASDSIDDSNGLEKLRSMVPAALLRNEDRLLEALKLCENVDSLEVWADSRDDMPYHRTLADIAGNDIYPFDVSSTFDIYMGLAARAGICPTTIAVVPLEQKVMCALTNAAGLVTGKEALRRIKTLHLAFIKDWRDDVDSEQEAGRRIGKQLYEGLENAQTLSSLNLDFQESRTSLWAWEEAVQLRAFPALEKLDLNNCYIWVKDFVQFILKHRDTLKNLFIFNLDLLDGSIGDIRDLLTEMRSFSKLEELKMQRFKLSGHDVRFPWAFEPDWRDSDDEEDDEEDDEKDDEEDEDEDEDEEEDGDDSNEEGDSDEGEDSDEEDRDEEEAIDEGEDGDEEEDGYGVEPGYIWVTVSDYLNLNGVGEVQEGLRLMVECIKLD